MYREYILQHYQNPKNFGTLEPADISHEDNNPLCGDEIRIDVRLTDDKKAIADIKFKGRGCAISQASASILTQKVKGKTLDEVMALTKDDVIGWLRIPISPMRIKCAILALMVLQAGIHRHLQAAS